MKLWLATGDGAPSFTSFAGSANLETVDSSFVSWGISIAGSANLETVDSILSSISFSTGSAFGAADALLATIGALAEANASADLRSLPIGRIIFELESAEDLPPKKVSLSCCDRAAAAANGNRDL